MMKWLWKMHNKMNINEFIIFILILINVYKLSNINFMIIINLFIYNIKIRILKFI